MNLPFINKMSLALLITTVCFFTSCVKEKLVLPEGVDTGQQEEIDVIAKPSDVLVKGEYNFGFKIDWPEYISDNVQALHLTYYKAGEEDPVKVDTVFEDFSESFMLYTGEMDEYVFETYFRSKSGKQSKTITQQVKNKDLHIKTVLASLRIFQESFTEYKLAWTGVNSEVIKIAYTVPTETDPLTLTVEVDSSGNESFVALEGTHDVSVQVSDTLGNTVDTVLSYTLSEVAYLTGSDKSRWTATASDSHGGHEAERLINGISDGDDHWHSNWYPSPDNPKTMHPFTLEIDFDTEILLTEVILHNRSGGNRDGARFFDLYGFDEEIEEYVLLGKDLEMIRDPGQQKRFAIDSEIPFSKIQLIITESWPTGNNANPANFAHIAEIDVKGFKRN